MGKKDLYSEKPKKKNYKSKTAETEYEKRIKFWGFLFFIVLCIVVFILVLKFSPDILIAETPVAVRNSPLNNRSSVYVTPSNVRVLNSSELEQFQEPLTYKTEKSDEDLSVLITQTNRASVTNNRRAEYVHDPFKSNHNRNEFRSDGEMILCEIVEEIIESPVEINVRPNFLKNPKTGRNLEYDLFSRKYKFAGEYSGDFHYNEKAFYNKNRTSFEGVKYRDRLKKELSMQNGIFLFCVPWTVDCGKKDINGKWKYVKNNREQRKELMKKYVEPILYDYLHSFEIEK